VRRAERVGRGAAQRKDAILEDGERRLAALTHGRDPVDRILDQGAIDALDSGLAMNTP
jgi:hypothetical protein